MLPETVQVLDATCTSYKHKWCSQHRYVHWLVVQAYILLLYNTHLVRTEHIGLDTSQQSIMLQAEHTATCDAVRIRRLRSATSSHHALLIAMM
jgi:hypothetical protein